MMHIFLEATSYPRSWPWLHHLSTEYCMPQRLWSNCIYRFLEALRPRLPESLEYLISFIHLSYSILQVLKETTNNVAQLIQYSGDLATYRSTIEHEDNDIKRCWKSIVIGHYEQALDLDPTDGYFYHRIGDLLEGSVSRLFNILKALTVSKPFLPAWDTIFELLRRFVAPEGQALTAQGSADSLGEDLYIAIARLLLASAKSERLQKHCFDVSKETHLLAFDALLSDLQPAAAVPTSNMPRERGATNLPPGQKVSSFFTHPSPKLALILCQLLLLNDGLADRAAQLLSAVNRHILARPAAYNVKLWEYLHVLLVFMYALNTQPHLKNRFRHAFHTALIAPFLNLLLGQLKDRGGNEWEALFRPEFPIVWMPLNAQDKSREYNTTTMDTQREYIMCRHKEENSVVPQSYTVFDKPVQDLLRILVLPEDYLLRGFSFVKQVPPSPKPRKPPSEPGTGANADLLRLDHYFYPQFFFKKSTLDREEIQACHKVQSVEMSENRYLRILWVASRGGGGSLSFSGTRTETM
ncbi:hypothetical protein F4802DRAFT_592347 [Xylaria palmicola]|nr:hypothetical protein F4802DRAFT_592347 [Xylaria palmicola]